MQLELFREGSMGRAECHNHNPITSNLLFCNSVPVWNVLKRICQTKLVTWLTSRTLGERPSVYPIVLYFLLLIFQLIVNSFMLKI